MVILPVSFTGSKFERTMHLDQSSSIEINPSGTLCRTKCFHACTEMVRSYNNGC